MRIVSSLLLLVLSLACTGSGKEPQKDQVPKAVYSHEGFTASFQKLVQYMPALKSDNELGIIEVAKLFLDTVYVGKTLEIGNDSVPVINVRELDCLTYIENTVALKKSKGDEEAFIKWISNIRYGNGKPAGYTSRLHYFSEWIMDNVKKGWIEDVTCTIGGDSIRFNTHFMSSNPQYYPQLKKDATLVDTIRSIEKGIQSSQFCYIPKDKIPLFENKIKDGDILGLTTNVEGLDFAHNGFAVHRNNRLYMLHASSDFKRVMFTEKPLAEYLKTMNHMTGIVVLRLTSNN